MSAFFSKFAQNRKNEVFGLCCEISIAKVALRFNLVRKYRFAIALRFNLINKFIAEVALRFRN